MLRIRTTVDNENIFLDLYKNEPVLLSLSFAELQDITKKNSNFSKAFSLPGSKKNNQVFNFFYDLNAIPTDFNPNNKFDATLMWDGYEIMVGSIRLNGVTIADNEIIYQVTFYNQVGNLMANIGDKFLFDLDLSYLSHPYSPSVILESNIDPDLFPITGATNYSYQNGKTMWGLYNIGYEYISGNTVNSQITPLVQFSRVDNTNGVISYSAQPGNFDYYLTPVNDYYFKPAIQAKELYEAIVREAGYEVESNFFNTSYFKRFYMPLKFADDTIYPKNAIPPCYTYVNTGLTFGIGTSISTNPSQNVQCNTLGWTGTSDTLKIAAEYRGTYRFRFTFIVEPESGTTCNFLTGIYPFVRLNFDDSVNPQTTLYQNSICDGVPSTISFEQDFILTGSSNLEFIFYGQYLNISSFVFEVVQGPRFLPDGAMIDYNIEFPDNDYKQIDFITSMNKYFNMVVVPNPDDPLKLIVEPIIDYIGKGEVLDWTTKIDFSQTQNLYPTSSLINGTLEYEFKLDQDYANRDFQGQANRIFGTDKIKLNLPYKDATTKFDYIFSSPIDITINNAYVPIVTLNSMSKLKQIDISGQTQQTFVPFKILPKLTFRGLTIPVDNYGFVGGSGATTVFCTSAITINVTRAGYVRYDNCNQVQTYQFFNTGSRTIPGCANYTTVEPGIPFTPLAAFTLTSSGTPCNEQSQISLYQYWYMDEFQNDRFTNINRFTTYPFNYNDFSHYINFRGEDQSNITPAEFSFEAKDLYDIYYKPYVDDLISEENKIYAAKIYLFPKDIERLRWNEKILVNNTYFRINKITNFNALEPSICDIELVKLTKDYPSHPVLYYDFIPCASGATLHSNSDLMYNMFAYANNYVTLYDTSLNSLGCYNVQVSSYNPNVSYQKYWIASGYTSNLVNVYENCGCSGRTEFEIVQETPTDERIFYYSALDCETSAVTYTFKATIAELSGGSASVKIYNSATTESICVFDVEPTFVQVTPWSYLSAYTSCEQCALGPILPTPTPTMTPTVTPTNQVLYWTLDPCELTEPQYSTTLAPLQASQRYIDPITQYRWTWDNNAPTTSPLHTLNTSLQRVSGQSGCVDTTPTQTPTNQVTPTPTATSVTPTPTPTPSSTPEPYCYTLTTQQSAPGECFDCPGYFASTTDTIIEFFDGCSGNTINAPFNMNVIAHYSDSSTGNTYISGGTIGSVVIATSDIQCAALPACGEVASPTFDFITISGGTISECCV
jgi:hypothetical protein